jgi:phosphonate transport system substrate-binding protein
MNPARLFRSQILLAAVALIAVAALAACGSNGNDESASASKTANASASAGSDTSCPNGKLRFGVEPYEDASKLTPAYEAVGAALSKKLGCPVDVQIVQTYAAEVLAMQNDKLDVAEFGPLGFVFANKRANAQPLASFGTADGKLSTYTAGIWVPKDSQIKTLADLKGKSLALSETGSTSGDGLPRYALTQAGLNPERDVKLKYAGGHPESMLALTHGKVDAAEVNSQQQHTAMSEHLFDPGKFRQIWKSDPIPSDPVTIRGSLPKAFQDKVKEALLSLPPSTLKQIGDLLDFNPPGNMQAVSTSTYKPLFDLADALHLTEKDV